MYNKIIMGGHLTRDIELRYTQGGSAIGNTAIASTRKFKGADGQQKEETVFVDLTFFGRTAEIANQYLKKGSKVLVDGRLKLDQWTAQDGTKRSKHSITVETLQMLDTPNSNNGSGGNGGGGQPQGQPQNQGQGGYQQNQGRPQGQPQGQPQGGGQPQGKPNQAQGGEPPLPEIQVGADGEEIPF